MESQDEPLPGTMLAHPIFVHWCESCGQEAPETAYLCPRCSGKVRRYQRVQELPDEDPGTLSLANLRAALADVLAGEDVGTSAVLLSEQGPDPGVASAHPALAADLAALGVPPAVQRALANRGFASLDEIAATAATATHDRGEVAMLLGLSPAAEVLLRRLWRVAEERRAGAWRAAQRRRAAAEVFPEGSAVRPDVALGCGSLGEAAKRLCAPPMSSDSSLDDDGAASDESAMSDDQRLPTKAPRLARLPSDAPMMQD